MPFSERLRELVPRGREAVPMVLAWLGGIVALLFLAQRFRYGVELTDETFSIAMPYRYALGDKPFVDEISIQQTAGIVLYPFVWFWVKLHGSSGLVLFVRVVHFLVFKGLAAVALWLAARRLLQSKAAAIATAFTAFVFVPHSIPNVGYNVIGLSLLVAGSFFLVAAINEESEKYAPRLAFIGGVTMAVMTFAYPPMGVAAVLSAPLLLVCASRQRFKLALAFVGGGVAGVVLVSLSLVSGGISGLRRSLSWGAQAGSAHGAERFRAMFQAYWMQMPPVVGWLSAGCVGAALLRSRALAVAAVLAGMLTLTFWYEDPAYTVTSRAIIYLGSLAPAFVLVAWPDSALVRSAVLVLVPSFAVAAVAAVFSTQQLDAAALGLIASALFVGLLGCRTIERAKSGLGLAILPALIIMYLCVNRAWIYMYRDAPIPMLTETVPQGPFKGLRTTPDRVDTLNELRDIVRRFDKPGGHILVLYEQPGFYLASKMPPSAHSVWEATYGDLEGMRATFEQKANGDGIVLRVKGTGRSPIDDVFAPADRKVYETKHFIVYRDK